MNEVLEIVPYDADWPRAFRVERDRIADALGTLALRIDHNGSTAIPGLAAKPIIDIQISVERLHPIRAYAPGLAQLDYVHERLVTAPLDKEAFASLSPSVKAISGSVAPAAHRAGSSPAPPLLAQFLE